MRAAIVGAGSMGRWHAAAAGRSDGTVVAVVDRELASAAALGVGAAYVDLETALAAHEVDIVHVCTPLDAHAEIVRIALAAGAHVIVEKPLAPDVSTTDQLLRLADDAGRSVVPVHQFLFQFGFRRTLERRAGSEPWSTSTSSPQPPEPSSPAPTRTRSSTTSSPTRSRSSSASSPARRPAPGTSAVRSPASSAPRRRPAARRSRS